MAFSFVSINRLPNFSCENYKENGILEVGWLRGINIYVEEETQSLPKKPISDYVDALFNF